MKRARGQGVPREVALSMEEEEEASLLMGLATARRPIVAEARREVFLGHTCAHVCETCGRCFQSFQALGGHRSGHHRGGRWLSLGVGGAGSTVKCKKTVRAKKHECSLCGLRFDKEQTMRRHLGKHRIELPLEKNASAALPVLLDLFV
jgi:hypothetical protein